MVEPSSDTLDSVIFKSRQRLEIDSLVELEELEELEEPEDEELDEEELDEELESLLDAFACAAFEVLLEDCFKSFGLLSALIFSHSEYSAEVIGPGSTRKLSKKEM